MKFVYFDWGIEPRAIARIDAQNRTWEAIILATMLNQSAKNVYSPTQGHLPAMKAPRAGFSLCQSLGALAAFVGEVLHMHHSCPVHTNCLSGTV